MLLILAVKSPCMYMLVPCTKNKFSKAKKMYQEKAIIHFSQRRVGSLICFENPGEIIKFTIHCLRLFKNPDVTSKTQQSMEINGEINSFPKFEKQISLEKGELNTFHITILHFLM